MPPLKSLVLTEPRVLISELLMVETGDGTARKLTGPELCAGTRLASSSVSLNMRNLSESGWFGLDWEDDLDPYDVRRSSKLRRIFVADGLADALSLCVKDFRAHRSAGGPPKRGQSIEYAPPSVDNGVPVGVYVPVQPGGVDVVHGTRAAVLLHCLKDPAEYHHSTAIAPSVGGTANMINVCMVRCEAAGLLVSKFIPVAGARDRRVYMLTEKGLEVARSLVKTGS